MSWQLGGYKPDPCGYHLDPCGRNDDEYRPCEHIDKVMEELNLEERSEENDKKIKQYLFDNCCNKKPKKWKVVLLYFKSEEFLKIVISFIVLFILLIISYGVGRFLYNDYQQNKVKQQEQIKQEQEYKIEQQKNINKKREFNEWCNKKFLEINIQTDYNISIDKKKDVYYISCLGYITPKYNIIYYVTFNNNTLTRQPNKIVYEKNIKPYITYKYISKDIISDDDNKFKIDAGFYNLILHLPYTNVKE